MRSWLSTEANCVTSGSAVGVELELAERSTDELVFAMVRVSENSKERVSILNENTKENKRDEKLNESEMEGEIVW
ncbi:hypothetical protein V6N13_063722 [Hibiscus sabdariffa]